MINVLELIARMKYYGVGNGKHRLREQEFCLAYWLDVFALVSSYPTCFVRELPSKKTILVLKS